MRKVLGSTGSGAVCQVRITGWKRKLPRCHGLTVTDHNSDPCPQMIGIKGEINKGQPPETGIGGAGNKKVTSKFANMKPATELRVRSFLRATTGVSRVARRPNRHSCGPDQSQDGYLKLY